MNNSIFPLELLEEIIDVLATNEETFDCTKTSPRPDRTGTQACSLVCKALLPRSRKHIFSDIRLEHEEDALGFRRLLDSNPTIAGLVRRRSITKLLPGMSHVVSNGSASFPRLESLLVIALHATQLVQEQLHSTRDGQGPTDTVLKPLSRSPFLTTLTFLGFAEIPLRYIPDVKHLYLDRLSIPQLHKSSTRLYSALETLSVNFKFRGYEFEHSIVHNATVGQITRHSPKLHTLSIEIPQRALPGLLKLIKHAFPTLKKLNLVIEIANSHVWAHLAFFEGSAYLRGALRTEMRSTKSANAITSLNLTFHMNTGCPGSAIVESSQKHWAKWLILLSEREVWPNLRKVAVSVCVGFYRYPNAAADHEFLHQKTREKWRGVFSEENVKFPSDCPFTYTFVLR